MSILKELSDYDGPRGRIVSFEVSADQRAMVIEECCDQYFKAQLTKGEFAQMITELQTLHAQMRE